MLNITTKTITVVELTDPMTGYTARFEGPDAETVQHMAANPSAYSRSLERLLCQFFNKDGRAFSPRRRVQVGISELGGWLEVDPNCHLLRQPFQAPTN